MAKLRVKDSTDVIYLKAFHRFGRLTYSVDTQVSGVEISRIHAVIEHNGEHWELRDLSKNGVWMNGQRIAYNQAIALKVDDEITFSEMHPQTFIVDSISPPKDLLIPTNHEQPDDVIPLEKYHFLPSESDPEIVVFYDNERMCWCYEHLESGNIVALTDSDNLSVANELWYLFQVEAASQEATMPIESAHQSSLEFLFDISLDEEITELKVNHNGASLDFDVRTHHYLTALLARYKARDEAAVEDELERGWVSVSQLSKDLGISESHINIQIHRARKQFVDLVNDKSLAEKIIERKRGRVRFGGKHFTIKKGSQTEASYDGLQMAF
ncbi:FHA domain-containing protein [Pseudoalteromonas sp. SMS1]|uniref:FHA domain-containing protein n=1 Tax=Pseudoalteromonas sp. SMS1 TaxID=2908894 RepID=UPI001F42089C|nr:FHA domain-containing protein [Pseudoalteromonas sp. SMS1]MCF2857945.1 FHA domain-containing protein [Pseudoalteromonas sp. SMS1]